MEADDTRVANLVDTVHHEIDSAVPPVRNHHVYKAVWSPLSNRTTYSREGACWPIHMIYLQYVAVIKDSQTVVRTPSEIYSHVET